jgi:hypothetical protein
MSGPNSKRTDVTDILRLCRGIASLTEKPGAYPGQGKDYPMRNFLGRRT